MDTQSGSQPVNETDARWITFAELAAARGIDKDSAVALVRRHGWRRQRDNRGHVIALVPLTWMRAETDSQADGLPDRQSDVFETALAAIREAKDGEIATLRAKIATLREELTRAIEVIRTAHNGEVAALGANAAASEVRADRAEAAIAGERTRADTLQRRVDIQIAVIDGFKAELEQAHQATWALQDAIKALRAADAARRARGRLHRVRAAWRGE